MSLLAEYLLNHWVFLLKPADKDTFFGGGKNIFLILHL